MGRKKTIPGSSLEPRQGDMVVMMVTGQPPGLGREKDQLPNSTYFAPPESGNVGI